MANIRGTSGNDTRFGTTGADIINRDGDSIDFPGTRGSDTLFGGAGNDTLYGGTGDDRSPAASAPTYSTAGTGDPTTSISGNINHWGARPSPCSRGRRHREPQPDGRTEHGRSRGATGS